MLLGGFVVCATCPGFDATLPGRWHFQKHFGIVFKILNTCIKSRGSDKEPGRPDRNWPDNSYQEPRKARASLAFRGQAHMSCLCCEGLDTSLTSSKMPPAFSQCSFSPSPVSNLALLTLTKLMGAERDWGWQPGGGRAGTSRVHSGLALPSPKQWDWRLDVVLFISNLNWQQAHGSLLHMN